MFISCFLLKFGLVFIKSYFVQEVCNGKGSCGCNGRCECQEPYLGTYCEFCSGDEICFSQTCERNRDCAACTVELLDQLPLLTAADFFTNVTLNNFPNGTTFTFDTISDTFQFRLPSDYCTGNCSQNVVIINGTDNVDYMIQGKTSRLSLEQCCMGEQRFGQYRVAFLHIWHLAFISQLQG